MITSIPKIIYDKNGNRFRVVKTSLIYFYDKREVGYVLHIEGEERVTTVSEYDLNYENGRYILTRDIFKNTLEM